MPNDVAVDQYSATFIDRDSEKSTTQVNVGQFADNPAYQAARDAFETAISNVTNGTRFRREATLAELVASSSPPNNNSFREDKWLLRVEDNSTFKRYSFTVATADPSTVTLIAGTDKVDLTVGAGLALKTAVEAFVVSPAGNAITLVEAVYVGRNI